MSLGVRERLGQLGRTRSPGTISSSRCQTTRAWRTARGRDVSQDADSYFRMSRTAHSRTGILQKLGRRDRRWWSQTGSNRRPPACKAGALPTELWPRASRRPPSPRLRRAIFAVRRLACQPKRPWPRRLVGLGRFELPTSRLSSARSNQLSYRPMKHTLAPRCLQDGGQWMLQRPWIAWARPRRKRNVDGEVPQIGMPILKLAMP